MKNPWIKGLIVAALSGAANGIVGLLSDIESIGQPGFYRRLGIATLAGFVLGGALYLKQSPLPPTPPTS